MYDMYMHMYVPLYGMHVYIHSFLYLICVCIVCMHCSKTIRDTYFIFGTIVHLKNIYIPHKGLSRVIYSYHLVAMFVKAVL